MLHWIKKNELFVGFSDSLIEKFFKFLSISLILVFFGLNAFSAFAVSGVIISLFLSLLFILPESGVLDKEGSQFHKPYAFFIFFLIKLCFGSLLFFLLSYFTFPNLPFIKEIFFSLALSRLFEQGQSLMSSLFFYAGQGRFSLRFSFFYGLSKLFSLFFFGWVGSFIFFIYSLPLLSAFFCFSAFIFYKRNNSYEIIPLSHLIKNPFFFLTPFSLYNHLLGLMNNFLTSADLLFISFIKPSAAPIYAVALSFANYAGILPKSLIKNSLFILAKRKNTSEFQLYEKINMFFSLLSCIGVGSISYLFLSLTLPQAALNETLIIFSLLLVAVSLQNIARPHFLHNLLILPIEKLFFFYHAPLFFLGAALFLVGGFLGALPLALLNILLFSVFYLIYAFLRK
ncbi:MAG: hypothetical protein FJY91_01010 [Candidatus Harrisonbacteria bacterium]|nr:hypothetical protein [Candidatus Harrisonbacteria bacterium]